MASQPITNPVKATGYPGQGMLDPEKPAPTERAMDLLTTGPQPGDHQRHTFADMKDGHYYKKRPIWSGYLGHSI